MSSASVKSCITTNIKEFLNESDDGEEEEEEEEEEIDEGDDEIKKDKEEDSKIDIEGFFQKKSGSSYKKVIKNIITKLKIMDYIGLKIKKKQSLKINFL